MRRTDVESVNDQSEGRTGETGDRRRKLSRLMHLVALPLLLGAALASMRCFGDDENAIPLWGGVTKFKLVAQVLRDGESLEVRTSCPGNIDAVTSYQLFSKEKTGTVTYGLTATPLVAFIAVNPSTNFMLRISYDDRALPKGSQGSIDSDPLPIRSVVTPTLKLYGTSDHTRANGLTFNATDWSARGITFAERQGAGVWFVVVDNGGKLYLASPDLVADPWGVLQSRSSQVAEDFDNLATCPPNEDPTWTGWNELKVGKTYALWQGQFGGWLPQDRFAKAQVVAIDSNEVTLKLAVQTAAGLRWIITD